MQRRFPVWDGVVDLDRQQVQRSGGTLALTPQEVALFEALAQANGATVSRDDLLVRVWGFPKAVRTRAVDHAMSRLRAKVEQDPTSPRFLLGVRGVGYRYESARPVVEGLVGRDADGRALLRAVTEHRRVTLVGPAGVGKTALLSWWAQQSDVVVVALEPVGPEGVVAAVARALGVPLAVTGDGGTAVGRALASRGTGWVALDAAEHVVDDVVGLLEAWSVAAPGLGVVVSSHGPLGVDDEAVLTLEPLDDEAGAALLAQRLEGTARAEPERLRALSRQVDGLPLALELLAARARVVPSSMWSTLAEQPEALVGRGKDASVQQAVLRTWRWLDAPLQRVLSVLSMFAEPPSLAAMEALLGASGEQVQRALDALAARALWRMPHGVSAAVRAVALASCSEALLVAQAQWVATAESADDDRLAAADRVVSVDPELAISLVLGVLRRSLWAGPLRVARADSVVEWAASAGVNIGEAYLVRGAVRTSSGDLVGAAEDLALAVERAATPWEAHARWGWLDALLGHATSAERRLETALEGAIGARDREVEAMVRVRWGALRHFAGDAEGALAHLQAAVGLYDALGDAVGAARARSSAGLMWLELGQPSRAHVLLREALDADRAQGVGAAVPQHLLNLGGVALDDGRVDDARAWLSEAEALAVGMGDVSLAGQARMSLGLADLLGDDARGALVWLHRARVALEDCDREVLVALAWGWTAVASWRCGDAAGAARAMARALAVERVPTVVEDALAVCAAAVRGEGAHAEEGAPSLVRMACRVVAV